MNVREYCARVVERFEMDEEIAEGRLASSGNALALKNAIGLAGEAGEVLEHVKKWIFHGRVLDRDAIKKEIGDAIWYAFAFGRALGFSPEEILEANVAKLEARYQDAYSDARCAAKADEK